MGCDDKRQKTQTIGYSIPCLSATELGPHDRTRLWEPLEFSIMRDPAKMPDGQGEWRHAFFRSQSD